MNVGAIFGEGDGMAYWGPIRVFDLAADRPLIRRDARLAWGTHDHALGGSAVWAF